jgi:hypothetical protein
MIMWFDILKNFEFDPTESCCRDLKQDYINFVHKLADYYDSIGVKGNLRNHDRIADTSCELVLNAVKDFLGMAKGAPKDSNIPSWVKGDLEKIIDDFEKCKEEPSSEKETQYDSLKVFADNQTAWMDKFIGGRQ